MSPNEVSAYPGRSGDQPEWQDYGVSSNGLMLFMFTTVCTLAVRWQSCFLRDQGSQSSCRSTLDSEDIPRDSSTKYSLWLTTQLGEPCSAERQDLCSVLRRPRSSLPN